MGLSDALDSTPQDPGFADALAAQGLSAPPPGQDPDALARSMAGGLAVPVGGGAPAAPPAPNAPLLANLPDQSADNAALGQQVAAGQRARAGGSYADLARRYGVAPAAPAPVAAPAPSGPPQGMGAYGGHAAPQNGSQLPDSVRQSILNYRAPGQAAGFAPTTQSIKTSPIDPAQQASLGELEQAKIEQAQAQQNYNAEAGKAMAPLVQRQANERAAFQANVKQSLDEHVQKIQTLTDNASKAANEAPESFWGDNPGTRILRTVGMAAMAFGHGLNGNAADPMQFMNSMIAQNAAKQKAKVDGAKGNLDREQNLYAMMKQKFGDDDSALTATQMLQKQAVLDKLDESFQAPTAAKVTWGKASEEDPEVAAIRNMPPTARLNLANMRLGIAQSIYEDRAKLFDKHATTTEASMAYHAAIGGPGDPAARLHTLAEAEKDYATINTAGRKASADVSREEAAAAAETAKADQNGPGQTATQLGGKPPPGISPVEHPLNYIASFLPGSKTSIDRQAYSSAIKGVLHKNVNVRSPELLKELTAAYEPHTFDSDETLRYRFQKLMEQYGHGAPASGVAPGETQDTGD